MPTVLNDEKPMEPSALYVGCRLQNSSGSLELAESHHCNCSRGNGKCIICGKKVCWSTNHPLDDLLRTLKKRRHIKSFIAQLEDTSKHDLDREQNEALDDLIAHVFDVSASPDDVDIESPDIVGNGEDESAPLSIYT